MTVTRQGAGDRAWGCTTAGEAETGALGERAGTAAAPGDALLLTGPVGAGKTVFAAGALAGLGAPGPHPSPTFTLVRLYQGRLPAAHVDLYRLGEGAAGADIGWDDVFDGRSVAIVEWAEFLGARAPDDGLWVDLEPAAAGAGARRLRLRATGPRSARLLAGIAAGLPGRWRP